MHHRNLLPYFPRKPLTTALLLAFSAYASAAGTTQDQLPDLGQPAATSGSLQPNINAQGGSLTWQDTLGGARLKLTPEFSKQTGFALGGSIAAPLTAHSAVGILLTAGGDKKEILFNAGIDFAARQRLIFTLGQLRQTLDFNFRSGVAQAEVTQNSGAVSYQYLLGYGLLNTFEVNGYLANTNSRDLADKTYTTDTATLYELWNDPRRIAGGRVTGLQGKLVLAPMPGGTLKFGLGAERLQYDLFTGHDTNTRATGSAEWNQRLVNGFNFKAAANAAAAQNRYSVGLGRSINNGQLGLDLTAIRGRDNAPDDNLIQVSYSYNFGGGGLSPYSAMPHTGYTDRSLDRTLDRSPYEAQRNTGDLTPTPTAAWSNNLLDQVAQRPSYIPSQVVARIDTSAAPVRLIAVNKTALPTGSTVAANGLITAPVGTVVAGIAGVTLNGGAFTNSGQFSLSGNNLVVNPSLITQPAVGVTDTYVVTINNAGGGTTLGTVIVSHGSVKIDSITMSAGAPADSTPPTTTSAPAVSNITTSGATLTATINEAGTGYYLVQATATAAPTVAAVVAANHSFAMAANTAASVAISGLTGSSAYTVFFVAKDRAGNVQAAVASAAVTTGTPTAPTASAVSISGTAQVGQTLTGSYTYADVNGDPQGTSTFRWLRNGSAIAGATASTYTLVAADEGNTISFEVTPVATVAPTTGTAVVSSATATVTTGYVSQGGLTWSPNNTTVSARGYTDWDTANTYCTTSTINGQTGWRLPTWSELVSLANSGAIAGHGWASYATWSSTPNGTNIYLLVDVSSGSVSNGYYQNNFYVSCVR
jgi:hypothetical protein